MADDNTAMRLAAATGPPSAAALNRHMLLEAMTACGTIANRGCRAEWTVSENGPSWKYRGSASLQGGARVHVCAREWCECVV